MSLSLIKKAFGLGKPAENYDFEEFFKWFDRSTIQPERPGCKNLRSHLVRFLVVGADGKKIFFDSYAHRDNPKPLPVFVFGSKQVTFAELVFGSDFLHASKDLLYSIKVHDVSSCGQLLVTRFVSDLDSWRMMFSAGRRSFGCKRASASVPQMPVKSDHMQNSIIACLVFNLEEFNECLVNSPREPVVPVPPRTSRRSVVVPLYPENQRVSKSMKSSMPKRFYKMLFEHCAPVSVLIESLADTAFLSVSKTARGFYSTSGTWSETQCADAISAAFSNFVQSFFDLCSPKLHFPVWSTLNNSLTILHEPCLLIEDVNKNIISWLNSISTCSSLPSDESVHPSFDTLASLFVRGCLSPLLLRDGNEHRFFLGQLVTGLLILHPGWLSSVFPPSTLETRPVFTQRSPPVSSPNIILNQLLVQVGCMETTLECLAGSVFNCTVLYGQSKKYLLALLFFCTYFLRYSCTLLTNEVIPDLGRADLFELEQQKRQRSRFGSKHRRKSGSAHSGDAHDSGISSQEDLSMLMFSASTGTSPIHNPSMALCMPTLLTRDQCRTAELAAQVVVNRELAATAARASAKHSGGGGAAKSSESGTSTGPSNYAQAAHNPHAHFLEVPLLIEKRINDTDDVCFCLPPESLPGGNTTSSSGTAAGSSSVSLSSPIESSPSVTIGTGANGQTNNSEPHNSSSQASPNSSKASRQTSPNAQPDVGRRSYTRPGSPLIANHNMIGNSVTEQYCNGLALQATTEPFDSFKQRLLAHLKQWLKLGPLIIRGMNLSMKQILPEHHAFGRSNLQPRPPLWSTSAMVVNCDTKTVEVITVRQPNTRYSTSSTADAYFAQPRSLPGTTRHSFSQPSPPFGVNDDQNENNYYPLGMHPSEFVIDPVRSARVKPAPLVMRMLDRLGLAIERTSCPSLALRDLENALQLIYFKSRIVADLLMRVGPSVLNKPNRVALAAGCSVADIPLLLSAASSYCLQAANILNERQMDWWFC